MSEETTQGQSQPSDSQNGDNVETGGLLDKADALSKGLDAKIKAATEAAERIERAAAKLMLGGRSVSGEVKKSPEQTEAEQIAAEVKNNLALYR